MWEEQEENYMALAWFASCKWEAKHKLNHTVGLAVFTGADLSQKWALDQRGNFWQKNKTVSTLGNVDRSKRNGVDTIWATPH